MSNDTGFTFINRAKSWADVFSVLSDINKRDEKLAGTLFEIFCKHYLITGGEYKNVSLLKEADRATLKKLNIEPKDHGCDLLLETFDNRFAAVQCKFTSDQTNKTLAWSGDVLSSWLASSTKCDIRIIFTNASGVAAAVLRKAEEKTYIQYDFQHLIEINKYRLKAIYDSIKGKAHKKVFFKSRAHQRAAIQAVLSGFKNASRGKLILPCGAGKTLTALWIKENLKPKRTLVLVPSLTLLRQFKNDWRSQERTRSEYFCVCSEQDISGSDTPEIKIFEIGGDVTTDPFEIRRLLKRETPQVVYATYQSSSKIARALAKTNLKFDLVVCDEAHRTSGDKNSPFGTILNERKIKASRRLYMTATPRIVSETVRDKLGNEKYKYLADMNDETLYGKEFFKMNFGTAIKMNPSFLTDYRIIAVGVTDDEVEKWLRERRFAKGTTVNDIAHNYALEKVMKKHGANHAITFHSRISSAKEFSDRHMIMFNKTVAYHVNGGQSSAERAIDLDAFRKSKKAVISNARCLTEGVDVPAIDMVYFCDSRNSKIDIVQATGRALRKHPGKKLGYIVVPLFHKKGKDTEKTIAAGNFNVLVQVVRAMADQDARIEEEIESIKYGKGERAKSKKIDFTFDSRARIDLEGFEGKLKSSIFGEIISKSVVRWRPLDLAREFVRSLNLRNVNEWNKYCRGHIKGKPPIPSDIPTDPSRAYRKNGWIGYGDWLGTGTISPRLREYRSFESARKFVVTLKLKNYEEWRKYCKGEFVGKPKLPSDIPVAPGQVYKNNGWISFGDWLGTGYVHPRLREYRSFVEARKFVRALNLQREHEWRKYCRGLIKGKPKLPGDIPSNPAITYKGAGWAGIGDWLGTYRVATNFRKYRAFKLARKFARSLRLKGQSEWYLYSRGKIKGKPHLPVDIPRTPDRVYKDAGWIGFGDWLGTGAIAPRLRKYRNFNEARKFARSLNLKWSSDWQKYCNGQIKGKPALPFDIPAAPWGVYANKGWSNFSDWLGSGRPPRIRKFRSFKLARKFVRGLNLKSESEWRMYFRGQLKGKRKLPLDIPSNPHRNYRDSGWNGMGDWLGTGTIAPRLRKYRSFASARKFARSLKLKNWEEWTAYCRGELRNKPKKPIDIHTNPNRIYATEGWLGIDDWLGTKKRPRLRKLRAFKAARRFVRSLKLRSSDEWARYCKGQMPNKKRLPDDIPVGAATAYKSTGWQGMGDWLGTGSVATHQRQYQSFKRARLFARSLKLKSVTEWNKYCVGKIRGKPKLPADIPSNAHVTYKGKGWISYGDWLGTGNIAPRLKQYRPFRDARKFARSLGLNSRTEWIKYCRGEIGGKAKLPSDIPVSPSGTYKNKGWNGMGDWLGTHRVATHLIKYRNFKAARKFARSLNLASGSEWKKYCRGEIGGKPQLPTDIPSKPDNTYKDKGWIGVSDWLGLK